jgi:malonyl-CoA/methylmalonyl-CoA synthetase
MGTRPTAGSRKHFPPTLAASPQMTALIDRAFSHASQTAFRGPFGDHTYAELLERSASIARALLNGREDLAEERIAFLLPGGMSYTETLWGIWRAGGIAVPLSAAARQAELEHVLRTAGVRRVIIAAAADEALVNAAVSAGASCLRREQLDQPGSTPLPMIAAVRRALIVFTSGTTSLPKGVVWTHGMLDAQIQALVSSWDWRSSDSIPLFLPLHHIHGILNVLSCALWSGACVEPFDGFNSDAILSRIRERAYSVFMAVPTIYARLAKVLENLPESEKSAYRAAFGAMRLMVSGSAALPARLHEQWQALTQQVLLERYGMTEIGMALSNPLHGERRPGFVGVPLPGMEIQLVNESGMLVAGENEPGEIWARGEGVFREYWENPKATASAFHGDWFRTGDVAIRERGYYRILGRQSVDIIKSGGYKISALEIEHVLLSHPAIAECAVVGLPDPVWGEVVCAAAVLHESESLDLQALREWCNDKLSDYKQPRCLELLSVLPRNALGKVVKPDLVRLCSRQGVA